MRSLQYDDQALRKQLARVVICSSGGNHAQGVALSTQKLGSSVSIAMPLSNGLRFSIQNSLLLQTDASSLTIEVVFDQVAKSSSKLTPVLTYLAELLPRISC